MTESTVESTGAESSGPPASGVPGSPGDGGGLRPRGRRVGGSGGGTRSFLRDLVVIVVVAVLASFLIKTFLVRSFYIPSESMEDTLKPNDRVLVDELVPRLVPLHRGDVIVFKDPANWLPASTTPAPTGLAAAGEWVLGLVGLSGEDKDDHLIKRVIGLPGDTVKCCNPLGQMTVNGSPLSEPYAMSVFGGSAASQTSFSVKVPAGELWVMGDNRDESKDSRYSRDNRYHGFVPESDVVGRAFVISWPVARWSVLSDYPDTFSGAATSGG